MGEDLAQATGNQPGLAAQPLSDHDRAIVERFAGHKAKAPKSQGQAQLERLLAVRDSLGSSAAQLSHAMTVVRGARAERTVGGGARVPETHADFFSALEALTEELERIAAMIRPEVADLSARF